MRHFFKWCIGVLYASAAISVCAQDVPISVLVGLPPGGASDTLARLVSNQLGQELNRTFVIENRPGASGTIAAQTVARAKPDGNTLLFTPSTHSTNAVLYPKLAYDTKKDFKAVGVVASTPYVLVVHPSVPANNLDELLAYLRAQKQKAFFATASAGSSQHISVALLSQLTGIDHIQLVHYKGSAAALPDVLSGRVPMMFDNIALMLPYIKEGRLRPVAVTSRQRFSLLKDVPTIAESGFPDFEVTGWFGLLAPNHTPDAVIARLATALKVVRANPEFAAKVRDIGGVPVASGVTEGDADDFIHSDIDRMRRIIDKAGIKLE